jgi:pSer/pThr/pTyr-binding forkhead associated (FHA) protein
MANLEITSLDGMNRTMTLEGVRLSLGRATDNDLAFPEDDGLSRHHFTLEQCGEDWGIEDLKSLPTRATIRRSCSGKTARS